MADDDDNRRGSGKTQIVVAVIGVIGTIVGALVTGELSHSSSHQHAEGHGHETHVAQSRR
jgi:hypothetical protein